MHKCNHSIVFLLLALFFAACEHYPRESERITAAFEQAQLVYGEGENDTILFIPELDKVSAYYARKKDFSKAALAALYHGYAEKDHNRTVAMTAFKDAEQYGKLVHDSLTVAWAQYQMGRMLFYDEMDEEALVIFRESEVYFGRNYNDIALVLNAEACSHILLSDYGNAESCLSRSLSLGPCNEVRQKVLNNYAKLCQMQGKYDEAINYLRAVTPENSQQMVLNLLNLGCAFMEKGEIDSAAYYFGQMKIHHIYTIFLSSNTNSNHKNTIMMKQITLLFLLLTVNVSFCQKHSNYYLESSEKGFVCINTIPCRFEFHTEITTMAPIQRKTV